MKTVLLYIASFLVVCVCLLSCKQVKLSDADERFGKGEYFDAADMYRQVYRNTKPKERELRAEVALKMAESYRLINNPLRANASYINAIRYGVADSTVSLQYARSLHKVGDYKQAATYYTAFLQLFPANSFALNGLEGTKLAPQWKKNPTRYTVKQMTLFGSPKGGEFSPTLLPPNYDQVYFTANPKEALGDTTSGITGAKYNDFFLARKDEAGNWMKPEKIEAPINTRSDEGTASFAASGNTVYYTYCPQDSLNISYADIYVSHRSGGTWAAGSKLKIYKDTTSVYAHPAISPSGDYLYFSSDMPGGYGGKDIWRAYMRGDEVDFVENLGTSINTAGDEVFPYMRNDSTLYFSSDGHVGMGGLDIFKAKMNASPKGWAIVNMQSPINSCADDFGISFEGDIEQGFFSSNRNDGRGYDHIYSFSYPTIRSLLEGFVVDPDDEFVSGATIRIIGNNGTNKKVTARNDGTYTDPVALATNYVLLASADGFLNTRMHLKTIVEEKDTLYYIDFVLKPINKPVVLENIFFDFDKASLQSESKEELDGLIELLHVNPHVSIELSAHTDRKGADEYNKKLAQRRAEAVVNYLIKAGIAADRLTAIGYGKSQPKTVTKSLVKRYNFLQEGQVLDEEFIGKLPLEQQEIADQINRRTEFKVVSIIYNME